LPKDPSFDLAVAPRYYDYQATLIWHDPFKRISGRWRHELGLLFFGSDDILKFVRDVDKGSVYADRGTFFNETFFARAGVYWKPRLGDRITSELTPSFGYDRTTIRIGSTPFIQESRTSTIAVRQTTQISIFEKTKLRFGLDLQSGLYALDADRQ